MNSGMTSSHKEAVIKVYSNYQASEWHRRIEENGFKLGVGLPITNAMVHMATMLSLMAMRLPTPSEIFVPQDEISAHARDIAAIRNSIVKQALDAGCSHLLFLDTDQVYPQDAATKLLAHKKLVVSAPVHRRYPPFELILNRGTLGKYRHVPDEECYSGDLIEIDSTGTGCILFDTEVFLDLQPPWFFLGERNGKPVGEDIGFCSRLREAGYQIFCDTSIEIGHLGYMLFDRSTYEINKNISKLKGKRAPLSKTA